MQVRPVKSANALRAFIELPYWLYRNDPVWVAPLRSEQRAQFDPKRNPFLDHCEWQLFLLKDQGRTVGRIAAFMDTLAMDFWKERIGLFGYFECLPSAEGARLLGPVQMEIVRTRPQQPLGCQDRQSIGLRDSSSGFST